MKEIGGYFCLDDYGGEEYYPDLTALNTGRNALLYIIEAKKIEKLHIPYYLCDSVSNALDINDIKYDYYHIDANFTPVFDGKLKENEYLYIVNYYGLLFKEIIRNFIIKFKNIIFDNTHAFFQRPIEGLDTIYSCRKFFGVPDGAYLNSKTKISRELEVDKSGNRMAHILGRYENTASEYYIDFKNNDKGFRRTSLKNMSRLTHHLLKQINYDDVIKKRNNNFSFLHEKLSKENQLNFEIPFAPYAYPYYCEGGIEIRKKLSKEGIYIASLWPNVLGHKRSSELEKSFVKNILPLPCDQRYSKCEMNRLIQSIRKLT